jgi:hypothetical protein
MERIWRRRPAVSRTMMRPSSMSDFVLPLLEQMADAICPRPAEKIWELLAVSMQLYEACLRLIAPPSLRRPQGPERSRGTGDSCLRSSFAKATEDRSRASSPPTVGTDMRRPGSDQPCLRRCAQPYPGPSAPYRPDFGPAAVIPALIQLSADFFCHDSLRD